MTKEKDFLLLPALGAIFIPYWSIAISVSIVAYIMTFTTDFFVMAMFIGILFFLFTVPHVVLFSLIIWLVGKFSSQKRPFVTNWEIFKLGYLVGGLPLTIGYLIKGDFHAVAAFTFFGAWGGVSALVFQRIRLRLIKRYDEKHANKENDKEELNTLA